MKAEVITIFTWVVLDGTKSLRMMKDTLCRTPRLPFFRDKTQAIAVRFFCFFFSRGWRLSEQKSKVK